MENIRRRKFLKQISLIAGGVVAAPVLFKSLSAKGETTVPTKAKFKPSPAEWSSANITIAWIGHSTMLINMFGTIILTDPVMLRRIGIKVLGITYGPERYTRPALTLDELPKPDIVLLSHAHMDHTDYQTLLPLTKKFPGQIDCITAFNTKDVVADLHWKSLKALDWGECGECRGIKFHALEVKHFGWRYPGERDRARGFFKNGRSYNAYVLEKNGKRILFGGDTAYTDKFKKTNIKDIDVAMMPIGAYNPWKFVHCNPEEALAMAKDMGAKVFIPIHWNTFKQSLEPYEEPLQRLLKALPGSKIELGLKEIGETFTLKA
jgi:L-ascorbate metabolism protein UlaG (beta-lactamase superfamily)